MLLYRKQNQILSLARTKALLNGFLWWSEKNKSYQRKSVTNYCKCIRRIEMNMLKSKLDNFRCQIMKTYQKKYFIKYHLSYIALPSFAKMYTNIDDRTKFFKSSAKLQFTGIILQSSHVNDSSFFYLPLLFSIVITIESSHRFSKTNFKELKF